MKSKSIIAGSILLSALTFGTSTTSFAKMGSGEDLRNQLNTEANPLLQKHTSDLSCGEGKCGGSKKEAKAEKKADSTATKSSEMKCGEGKCGGSKKEAKKTSKKSTKK